MRNGTKYRAQMYTIRKPSYHLRKLVLASKVEFIYQECSPFSLFGSLWSILV